MIRRRLHPRTSLGFTLVELMVVIVIIGLAAAAVVLMLPESGTSLSHEAERFAARARAARDRAITEHRPTLIGIDGAGYRIATRRGDTWQTLAEHDWEVGTTNSAVGETDNLVRFDSTGLATPLRLTLTRGSRQAAVEIGGNGTINVQR